MLVTRLGVRGAHALVATCDQVLGFNAPEGSCASSAADRARRIVELRQMVMGLHAAGLRVGMDGIYNHTTASGQNARSVLDRIEPGCHHRLDTAGVVTNSSGCDNTATEHPMMGKLMIHSAVLWAREYKIASFRFDLMGHPPRAGMEQMKTRVNAAAGRKVQLFGEGWNFGEVINGTRFAQIKTRLVFHKLGSAQVPTLLAASMDGNGYACANHKRLAYFINVGLTAQTLSVPALAGQGFLLHPVQAAATASDRRVASGAAVNNTSGAFTVPPTLLGPAGRRGRAGFQGRVPLPAARRWQHRARRCKRLGLEGRPGHEGRALLALFDLVAPPGLVLFRRRLASQNAPMVVLVIGATGALGRPVVQMLRARGVAVRALNRHPAQAADLAALGAETVAGDLTDATSLQRACQGVDRVLACAHGLLGRGAHRSEAVDDAGHRTLIAVAQAAGVRRLVYTSAQGAHAGHPIDFFRTKYAVEQALWASGLDAVILRPTAFMEHHVHLFNGLAVLQKGKAQLVGPGTKPRNFVCARDVAVFAVRALLDDPAPFRMLAIGGPGHHSNLEVAALYARLAQKPLRVSHLPLAVARTLSLLAKPFNPGLARIMKLLSLPDAAMPEYFDGAAALEREFGVRLTTVEDFVREQVAHARDSSAG